MFVPHLAHVICFLDKLDGLEPALDTGGNKGIKGNRDKALFHHPRDNSFSQGHSALENYLGNMSPHSFLAVPGFSPLIGEGQGEIHYCHYMALYSLTGNSKKSPSGLFLEPESHSQIPIG